MRRSRRVLFVGVVVGLVTGGCSVPPGATPSVGAPSSPSAEQRAQWALPLDGYSGNWVDGTITNYAEDLLVEVCMNAQKMDWPIPRIDINALSSSTMSPSGSTLLTTQSAAEFGYHSDPIWPADVDAVMSEMNSRPLTAAMQAGLDGCIATARQTLPLPPNQPDRLGWELAVQAWQTADANGAVRQAAGAWRRCMAPQGISDLPDTPSGMPTDSMAAPYSPDEPEPPATAAEITIAVADVACRQSSGYDDALYAAQWAAQSELLTKNADALVREGAVLADYLAAAKKIITERTGA